jgi:hypothetical protein
MRSLVLLSEAIELLDPPTIALMSPGLNVLSSTNDRMTSPTISSHSQSTKRIKKDPTK